jgi:hypothetical protein
MVCHAPGKILDGLWVFKHLGYLLLMDLLLLGHPDPGRGGRLSVGGERFGSTSIIPSRKEVGLIPIQPIHGEESNEHGSVVKIKGRCFNAFMRRGRAGGPDGGAYFNADIKAFWLPYLLHPGIYVTDSRREQFYLDPRFLEKSLLAGGQNRFFNPLPTFEEKSIAYQENQDPLYRRLPDIQKLSGLIDRKRRT